MPSACDFDIIQKYVSPYSDVRNTTTYTGIIDPSMTLGTFKRFKNRDLTENTMMLYGYGDGGGGPTKEMLEEAKRLQYGMPGLPRLVLDREEDFLTGHMKSCPCIRRCQDGTGNCILNIIAEH